MAKNENTLLSLNLFGEDEEDVISEEKKKSKVKKRSVTTHKNNEEKGDKEKTKDKQSTKKTKTFKYPFSIYSNGSIIDICNYGFEDDTEYTEDQISKIMLSHKHYEFSAEKKNFKFIEEDNVLYYSGSDFKKG